jgi:hypothetical protein
MTPGEMKQYQEYRRERWGRIQAQLNAWRPGGPTWKPTMTEQQKQEHEQHVKDNKLPF